MLARQGREKYPEVKATAAPFSSSIVDKPSVSQLPKQVRGQDYPTVSGKPAPVLAAVVVGNNKKKIAPPNSTVIPEPAIKGRWIIKAKQGEYPNLKNSINSSISGFTQVERKEPWLYVSIHDYKNEKNIKSSYAAIRNAGVPHENILGFQRETEQAKEEKSDAYNPNTCIYDNYAKLTPYGLIVQRINKISSDWKDNPLTKKKEAILQDFLEYYYKESNISINVSKIRIISGWVASYKKAHPESNPPFFTLGLGRRDCWLSMFNKAGKTKSLQLFEEMIPPTEKKALQQLMEDELGVKSSCFDGLKKMRCC